MKTLSYQTLHEQNYTGYLLKNAPERVIQFGEGNFMRAFVDCFFDILNEKTDFNSKVVLVQPVGNHNLTDVYAKQEGLYTLYLRGYENGKKRNDRRIISCVSRCLNPQKDYKSVLRCADNPDLRFITCNTTEAGIVFDPLCRFTDMPPRSFPAKLTQFLYRRFQKFGDQTGKGFIILPCELIDDNGKVLRDCVLKYARQWQLGSDFIEWLDRENIFCSTLVDRIVTGYPQSEAEILHKENGYEDLLLDTGELFGSWVIEGPAFIQDELPFVQAGLPVLFTDDHKPYKQRKVRILNGAHTSMVLGAYLAGQTIVRDCMEDEVIRNFMNKTLHSEIIPTLTLSEEDCKSFAASVTERFRNPFIDHALLAISLNSTSKWKARVLPSLSGYVKRFGTLPVCITASFAFYLQFYRQLLPDTVKDERTVLDFFEAHRNDTITDYVHAVCSNTDFWDTDLTAIPGFEKQVNFYMEMICQKGAYEVMKHCASHFSI